MTASKSSRARTARAGAKASATGTRNGSAARNGSADRGGAVGGGGGQAATVTLRGGAPERVPRGRAAADDLADTAPRTGVPTWMQLTTFLLALAGLGVSVYLTVVHFTESSLAGCSETKGLVDCTKVTTSPQSYVFGIPVAVLGLAFYGFVVAIISPWAWRAARREIHLLRIVSLVAGIGFVLYLLYAELFIIGSICLYCTGVHVITFVLFALTLFAAAAWGLAPSRQAT